MLKQSSIFTQVPDVKKLVIFKNAKFTSGRLGALRVIAILK
jgi:hypothetical protein